jgi:hypothetical protein
MLIVSFQLSNLMLVRRYRLADDGLTQLLGLHQLPPATHRRLAQLELLANPHNREPLLPDHLHYLQLDPASKLRRFCFILFTSMVDSLSTS